MTPGAPPTRAPGDTVHTLGVGEDAPGQRLDRWLASHLPSLSRARLQALIESGDIQVDGAAVRASTKLKAGQEVTVHVPAPTAAVPVPEDLPLTIVHEDAQLVVLDKPPGLVVHPGAGVREGTLVSALLFHVKDLSGLGGVLRPGIVHRLDRGTSGLMVVAKDDATHRALAAQFQSRTVEKEYLAVVHGGPLARAGEVTAAIGRDPAHRKRMSVTAPRGRAARSSWTVVERLDGASLVSVRIHTGRTHQVRVHLASIGHPLVGDTTYGGGRTPSSRRALARTAIAAFPRPALHSARLGFTHPATGARLEFRAPAPADFARLVEALRSPPKEVP